jgi:triacylglycerol lipase
LVLGVLFTTASFAEPRQTTRQPIILAHGILSSDGLFPMKKLAAALERDGHRVFLTAVNAVGSIELRAGQLARQIEDLAENSPTGRVNVIAHSMGGLDARYAISKLHCDSKVASLTTLATPHRGTPIADDYYEAYQRGRYRVLAHFLNFLTAVFSQATELGEGDLIDGIYDLTTFRAEAFNRSVLNSPNVYYQSFAAQAYFGPRSGFHPLLKKHYRRLYPAQGENDGMVAVSSAKWGKFRGTVGADHYAIAGFGAKSSTSFRADTFVRGIAAELARLGY